MSLINQMLGMPDNDLQAMLDNEALMQQMQQDMMPGDGQQFAAFTVNHAAGQMEIGAAGIDPNQIAGSISFVSLQEMGLVGSALSYYVTDTLRNIERASAQEAALKVTPSGVEEAATEAEKEQLEKELEAQRDLEEKQRQQQQWENEQRLEQERLEQERILAEKAAENRPAEDALNASILGLPMKMGLCAMGLGLGATAVNAAGAALSPNLEAVGSPQMVAGTGEMLAAAQASIGTPGAESTLVTGPNQLQSFVPGQEAPSLTGNTPGMAPEASNAGLEIPGMSGPGMNGPTGGMG